MPNSADFVSQILLTEYTTLKAEIHGRSRDQLLCIINSLIACGALCTAIAISDGKLSFLILIIPWILSIFGILWCDHHSAIHYIGAYLRKIENEEFKLLLNCQDFPTYKGWENWINVVERERRKKTKYYLIPFLHKVLPIIYFSLPSVFALLYYCVNLYKDNSSLALLPFITMIFKSKAFEMFIIIFDLVVITIFWIFYYRACISTSFKPPFKASL